MHRAPPHRHALELRVPVRKLKEATVEVALYRSDKEGPVRTAKLSQLRAGKLELVLSTAGLAPGSYRLVATLKPPVGAVVREVVSFKLTSRREN